MAELVGRLAGGWFGGWVAVVSGVGECVRSCGRWGCYLFGTTTLFCSLRYITGLLKRFSGTQRIRLLLYCCSMVGGCVVWYQVRRWCVVGELEANVVLVRLLCCVLLPFLAAER